MLIWVGTGWVTSPVDRVGSGRENLTHVQLLFVCLFVRSAVVGRWSAAVYARLELATYPRHVWRLLRTFHARPVLHRFVANVVTCRLLVWFWVVEWPQIETKNNFFWQNLSWRQLLTWPLTLKTSLNPVDRLPNPSSSFNLSCPILPYKAPSVVCQERWSLTGELSLYCARPAADGWPLIRCTSANQADLAFHPFGADKWVVGCNYMSVSAIIPQSGEAPSGERLRGTFLLLVRSHSLILYRRRRFINHLLTYLLTYLIIMIIIIIILLGK